MTITHGSAAHAPASEAHKLLRLRLSISTPRSQNHLIDLEQFSIKSLVRVIIYPERFKMSGYEKIADLMTKHAEMATFQRFDFLNTMNMLFLQAELVHLEDELRESMRDDLQSGQQPAPSIPIDATSRRESTMTDENVINESGRSRNENEHEMASISSPKSTKSQTEANHTSDTDSEENERAESGKDWYVLANMSHTSTWDIMLKIRQKLKEYGQFI